MARYRIGDRYLSESEYNQEQDGNWIFGLFLVGAILAGLELLSNVVYGVGQAAFLSDSSSTCTPSLNFTLFTTNVSSANPLSRFHFFFATSSSL